MSEKNVDLSGTGGTLILVGLLVAVLVGVWVCLRFAFHVARRVTKAVL